MAELLAILGGTVIDGKGNLPIEDGVILIEDDRLLAVGDRTTELPTQARKINATGKYVIPGLMDANVHLVLDFWPLTLVRYEGRYDELAIEAAQITLGSGVTTVFDTWGPREYLIRARDVIKAGQVTASRIYLGGNIVGLGGPFTDDFFPKGREALFDDFSTRANSVWQENVGPELVWMSPEQVRHEIREYAQRDIDFLKFAVTTHRGDMQHIMFSPRVQRVIVEEAHHAGLTAQTHTTSNEGLDLAIQARVDLMQHLDLNYGPYPIPRETLASLAESRIPGALLPHTAEAMAWHREHERVNDKRYETWDLNTRAVLRAGVIVMLSTDGGVFSSNTLNSAAWKNSVPPRESLLTLGEGHFNWLLAVEQKGMKPMDALMAATRNIARAYKVDKDLGTLEKGKIADLVILDQNPLESAANYRSISLVMKEGRVVDRTALPSRRLLTEPGAALKAARQH